MDSEGWGGATHQRPLGAVACHRRFLLTCALLMTSSHWKTGDGPVPQRADIPNGALYNGMVRHHAPMYHAPCTNAPMHHARAD